MQIKWDDYERGQFYEAGATHGFLIKVHDTVSDTVASKVYADRFVRVTRFATQRGKIAGYRIDRVLQRPMRSTFGPYYVALFTGDRPRDNRQGVVVVRDPLFWLVTFRAGRHTNYLALSRVRLREAPPSSEEDSTHE